MRGAAIGRVCARSGSRAFELRLAILLIAGLAVRILFVALRGDTHYATFDMDSIVKVISMMRAHPLLVYSLDRHGSPPVWPYPPMAFAWLWPLSAIHELNSSQLAWLVRIPGIAADLGIAWIVQAFLGQRGARDRVRLTSAALVALGPMFVGTSAVEGQIDSVAWLCPVAALYMWGRLPEHRRWIAAGLLIGVGAAIKTVPLVMALAFVPMVSNWRQGFKLIGGALIVPILAIAPFWLADPATVHYITSYQGFPGSGGLGMLVQPELTRHLLNGVILPWNPVQTLLQHTVRFVLPATLATCTFVSRRRRTPPHLTGTFLLLAVYVFNPNYFAQYSVWGLPIFLMSAFVAEVALAQALLFLPLLIESQSPSANTNLFLPYFTFMAAAWLLAAVGWLGMWRRSGNERPAREFV